MCLRYVLICWVRVKKIEFKMTQVDSYKICYKNTCSILLYLYATSKFLNYGTITRYGIYTLLV